MSELLRIQDLTASYGHMRVVNGVSLHIDEGDRVCLVGRNGAGKTTTLLAISGALDGGFEQQMWVRGEPVRDQSPLRVIRSGVSVVTEGHQVFPDMSVKENLQLGAFHRRNRGRSVIKESLETVYELFPLLFEAQNREAGQLSGGGQQMLSIGQALMTSPECLLLDEPSSGLAPAVVDAIYGVLDNLSDRGKAILVVEQNVDRALSWSLRCYVMDDGCIVLEGPSSELARSGRADELIRGVSTSHGATMYSR